MNEERFGIELNQEDVQNLINCYEKDIEFIKQLQQENKELHNKIDKAIDFIENRRSGHDWYDRKDLLEILKGDVDDR